MSEELLKNIVYRRIFNMITLGKLPLGAKLSETVLASRLQATRAPVRDALKRLQAEGLVSVKAKSGTFVFNLTSSELNDLLEFRYSVESQALKLAFERNEKPLVQELCSILDRMELCFQTGSVHEYLKLDGQFHSAIILFCDNPYFKQSYKLVSSRMAAIRVSLDRNLEHMARSFEQHKAIMTALNNHNIGEAQYQLLCHTLPSHGAYWDDSNVLTA